MQKEYMMMIWSVFFEKKNQNLSSDEQQEKILEILSKYKLEVQEQTKTVLKSKFLKETENILNQI